MAQSLMAVETGQAAQICAQQVAANRELMREAGRRLRSLDAPFAATLARGSSDHAAAFAKVLFETRCATPTLSQTPSLGALYHGTSPRFSGVPVFAISQSGRSPDLIQAARDARRVGAVVFAVVNDPASPLAEAADVVIPVHAGPERSVAATKSFIATLVALTHLAAEWSGDARTLESLDSVGEFLTRAADQDWGAAIPILARAESLLVLGRGHTLPVASEAALKLKETAALHAEAFSIAEVAHGPMTLVGEGDPVLVFAPADEAREGVQERLADFRSRRAQIVAAGPSYDVAAASLALQVPEEKDPALLAIGMALSFYGLAERLARERGRDPDHPPHLSKVTRTL